MKVMKVDLAENIADILTKALCSEKFENFSINHHTQVTYSWLGCDFMLPDSQRNRFNYLSTCYKHSLGFILCELLSYKV